jgi:hypothetical protein
MFGSKASKTISSNTPAYPTPRHLIVALIGELLKPNNRKWLHVDDNKSKGWAEVALDEDDFLINISFPFKDNFEKVFLDHAIQVPESWKLDYFKKNKAVTFRTTRNEIDSVSTFIDTIFKQLYNCNAAYILSGNLQG